MKTDWNAKTTDTQIPNAPKRSNLGTRFRSHREWRYRSAAVDCICRSEQHRQKPISPF